MKGVIILYKEHIIDPKTNRWHSAKMNNLIYDDYFNRLTDIGISMFEWKNLPDSINERFMEYILFYDGKAVFFYDNILGYLCLQFTYSEFNVYREPIRRQAYAVNGYNNNNLNIDNSVIIWNNSTRRPSAPTIQLFAERLYEVERSINTNIKGQKTPYFILCNESERLTYKNLYMKYDGNEPVIFGSKDLDLNNIKCIPTPVPYVADKLTLIKHDIWNEAMTYLGVSNSNEDKKERLVTSEVETNQGDVNAARYTRLNMRRIAAQQINNMFGLNISVDYRKDLPNIIQPNYDSVQNKEGENN